MKVSIAQIKPVLGDLEENLKKHRLYVEQARAAGADLVVFPELSLTGYSLKDLTNEVAIRLDDKRLLPFIELSSDIDIVVGLVEESEKYLYFNSALYLSQGRILHSHRKIYLPTYGMFEEGRHFAMGNTLRSFKTKFGKFGVIICEEAWHTICPLLLTLEGALFVINIADGTARGVGTPGRLSSAKTWERMNTFYAINHSVFFLFANRVGVEDGVTFWGGSELLDPFGELVIKGSYFDEELLVGEIDFDLVRRARIKSPLLRDERIDFSLRELNRISESNHKKGSGDE